MDKLKKKYLNSLPDIPRWVETRDLLAWEGSSIIENRNKDGFVVWSEDDDIGSIVGNVEFTAMSQAANDCSELLAFPENINTVQEQLTEFQAEQASIFEAPKNYPTLLAHSCKPLSSLDLASMKHLPDELKDELLELEDDDSLLIAAFEGVLPVAFAYVASETESLWDVSNSKYEALPLFVGKHSTIVLLCHACKYPNQG